VTFIWWRGVKMNREAVPSLLAAEKHSGLALRPVQGGYNAGGVRASAGTHDGGGVVDVSVRGWNGDQIRTMVGWLRRCGWAAWHRTPAQGFAHHIHAVRVGDSTASRSAQAQVVAYRHRRNGLARNGPDDGPWVGVVTWSACKYRPGSGEPAASRPAASRPAVAKGYVIDGKSYDPPKAISVRKLNEARRTMPPYVTPQMHRVQVWLSDPRAGGFYTVGKDGRYGPKTQQAYDHFRAQKLGLRGKDATGDFGFMSLSRLAEAVGSKYKITKD
jgi:hypothetical protein